ncbi:MAG: DUF1508 domain-containing protein [Ignavibacteriae bacterium]|nr:DUF1508 domain-containing protein [Ignavibacteriota bacterium]
MIFYMHKDKFDLWRWNLVATNNKKIAESSENYLTKQDCINAILLVKISTDASIVELSNKVENLK